MPSNFTENYSLNQWSKDDRVLMEDFNADNAKIDAALGTMEQTVAEHSTLLPKLGNCGIYVGSYIGRGDSQPVVAQDLPGWPMVLYVQDGATRLALLSLRGMTTAYTIMGADYQYNLVWGERSVSWTNGSASGYSLNYEGRPYFYMVLYTMDE